MIPPRSPWKLTMEEELVRGKDGLVCPSKIRTQNGLINRAILELYSLEVGYRTV